MQDIERYVSELSEAVWEQTVGLPLIPAEVGHAAGTRIFEGHVHIFGPWTGTLVLQCSHGAATSVSTFRVKKLVTLPQSAQRNS